MVGPSNILMGDISEFEAPVEVEGVVEEKKKAQYAVSEEFQQIQAHCVERIAFYQTHLPDGKIIGLEVKPTDMDWAIANVIISEFNLLMNIYNTATEAVTNE